MNKLNAITAIILIAIISGGAFYGYTQYFAPSTSGTVFWRITAHYIDGTQQSFDQPPVQIPALSMVGGGITLNGKSVSTFDFDIMAKITTNKQITSWAMMGTAHGELYLSGEVPRTSATANIDNSGQTLVSGQAIRLIHIPLDATLIAGAMNPNGGSGYWSLQYVANIRCSMSFSDGQVKVAENLQPVAVVSYNYDGSLSILMNQGII